MPLAPIPEPLDPERYRTKDEVESWRARDPLTKLRTDLVGIMSDDDVDAIEAEVLAEIDDAVAFAEAGGLEAVEDLTRFVTSETVP